VGDAQLAGWPENKEGGAAITFGAHYEGRIKTQVEEPLRTKGPFELRLLKQVGEYYKGKHMCGVTFVRESGLSSLRETGGGRGQ